MIPIAKPLLGDEEKRAVLEVLDSGMLAQGEKVKTFEAAFAEYIGVKHAIATSNGTTALHAALLAHGIGPGDEVITTPFSFIATANAIRMCGATPVFVDIDEKTFNLSPDLIEPAITPKTKAILPVHLYGQCCGMDKIMQLAEKHKLIVIEDACQAHGAEYSGTDGISHEYKRKKAGSFGTGCFSFYPTKNMTTGEGGMITTNDDVVAAQARKIIDHGSSKKYHHDLLGYNYRMTDIAAALGMVQLQKLDAFLARRRENARFLRSCLQQLEGIGLPADERQHEGKHEEQGREHAFHQFTIRITQEFGKTRDEVQQLLEKQGIQSVVYYPLPLHLQEALSGYSKKRFPVAEKAAREVLSLPVHPGLSREEQEHIAHSLIQLKKNALREQMRAARKAISKADKEKKDKAIISHLKQSSAYQKARSILFYCPFDGEASLLELLNEELEKKEKKIILPAMAGSEMSLREISSLRELQPGKYGLLQPEKNSPEIPPAAIDLVLVPGTAFDTQGNRLGFGWGNYDRLLGRLQASGSLTAIGIAFQEQLLKNIPAESHDVPLNIIITDRGVLQCR